MIVLDKIVMPKGFKAGGIHAGIKKAKKDMALIFSEKECSTAGTFTTNKVKAAPVKYDISVLKSPKHGLIVNSGNANACTSERGDEDARKMAEIASSFLGGKAEDYFVCSTGVIGVPLPMAKIEKGIKDLSSSLSPSSEALMDASEAILTTDTCRKEASVKIKIAGKDVIVTGFAKGSGMIHPNMATMLCFILTDADISSSLLQKMLGDGVEDTFNMISVDGDTSTNDTCLILANGEAGNDEIVEGTEEYALFKQALDHILMTLACMIVKDGEGAGRFIEVKVEGAKSKRDAKKLARSIVSSNLVKAAFFGSDANWGRILCAMGYSKADFNPDEVDLVFSSSKGSIEVLKGGRPHPFSEEKAKMILQEKSVSVLVVLHDGEERATAWGCDLTYDYVRINGDYRS